MAKNYVVFDFETTGLSAQKNEIIQIGAVKFDQDNHELARFNQLVKPQHSYVSSVISELTGIYPRDLLEMPYIQTVLPDFLNFIEGSLLVAHNAPFDISFLYQAIIDCGIKNVENFQVYDTLTEAKKLMKDRSYKLENLKKTLGVALRSHDALNDCLITAVLYQHLQQIEVSKQAKEAAQTENDGLQLDLFSDFTGEGISEELRRKLGLPITKSLVYFRQKPDKNWQALDIQSIAINQDYSVGFSLCLTLENQEKVNIHSDFLAQMQKKNFTKEMSGV